MKSLEVKLYSSLYFKINFTPKKLADIQPTLVFYLFRVVILISYYIGCILCWR